MLSIHCRVLRMYRTGSRDSRPRSRRLRGSRCSDSKPLLRLLLLLGLSLLLLCLGLSLSLLLLQYRMLRLLLTLSLLLLLLLSLLLLLLGGLLLHLLLMLLLLNGLLMHLLLHQLRLCRCHHIDLCLSLRLCLSLSLRLLLPERHQLLIRHGRRLWLAIDGGSAWGELTRLRGQELSRCAQLMLSNAFQPVHRLQIDQQDPESSMTLHLHPRRQQRSVVLDYPSLR